MDNNKNEANSGILERLNDYLQMVFRPPERSNFFNKTTYWIKIFQKILSDEPQHFYFSKENNQTNLWLFSDKYILKTNNFLHDSSFEKDEITIYPLSQIIGHIDIEVENYSLLDSSYGNNSEVTLRLKVNQLSNPVVLKARNFDCPQLMDVANFMLKNID